MPALRPQPIIARSSLPSGTHFGSPIANPVPRVNPIIAPAPSGFNPRLTVRAPIANPVPVTTHLTSGLFA